MPWTINPKPLITVVMLASVAICSSPALAQKKVSSEDCAIVYHEGSRANSRTDPFFAVAMMDITPALLEQRYQQMLERLDTTAADFDNDVLAWLSAPEPLLHNAEVLRQCDNTFAMQPVYQ